MNIKTTQTLPLHLLLLHDCRQPRRPDLQSIILRFSKINLINTKLSNILQPLKVNILMPLIMNSINPLITRPRIVNTQTNTQININRSTPKPLIFRTTPKSRSLFGSMTALLTSLRSRRMSNPSRLSTIPIDGALLLVRTGISRPSFHRRCPKPLP